MVELKTELLECLNEKLVQCIISNPKNKELTVDDATVTIVEIIFSDKNSMSVSMTEQTLDSLEKAFFALAEKYCKNV